MQRQRLLWLITVLSPLVLLAAVEGALRLAGVGALEPLFVPVASAPGYLQPNPDAIRRFFPDPSRAPDVSIDTTWFPARKDASTLRIFVQGESSAAGFPYGRWASPAAMLQQRLQRSYPDRNVEVVNTAMAAVTSYVLLDFADEIIAQQPDAVVIYTGHNEFLGIGGVGSSLVSARSPVVARAIASLRRLHVYRALERTLGPVLGPEQDPLSDRGGTLMARVAKERSIPLDSGLFVRGERQFRGNLDRLLARYAQAGVPVFVGTLASNLRDQPPFVSVVDAGPDSAAVRYETARRRDRDGKYAEALVEYTAAKDLDGLRFRAPESFDTVIRDVAKRRGATVVDVRGALANAARDGIVGADLMLEHVHPNVEGYFRLASAFYPALVARVGQPTVAVDDAMARAELPVTEIDRLHGEYRVAVLRNDWPFVPERRDTNIAAATNRIEEIAQAWFVGRFSWADAMKEALGEYQQQGDVAEAARVAVNLADAYVASAKTQYAAGQLLLRANAAARGLHYLQRAVRLDPATIEYQMSVAQAQFMLGRIEDSIATLERVLLQHPGESRAEYWLGEVKRRAPAP
ncbi:MAG TPA: GDSL-type esterase/lipase family protein [Steroidobacteraceae bacterium]|nr:GDSL-type esterase/lipase family protein [Steroidobacteraceae bacterium]